MDPGQRTEAEAAAFRRLIEHLRERADVQNMDLMEKTRHQAEAPDGAKA